MSVAEVDAVQATDGGESRLARRVAGVAGYLEEMRRRNRRGDLAMLRRLGGRDDAVPPEVFWRIVERYEIPPADETFWLGVLPLMVRHPHRPRARPGAALARAGVSGSRLERWLRLEPARALSEAPRLLSRLDGPFDWVDFAYLLRDWTEVAKRRLARDFFLAPEQRDRAQTPTGDE